jgi:hypothetical protein
MAKDLAYLRAQTRTYLDEASSADWHDNEVDREINNGYQELVAAVVEAYEDFYVTDTNFDIVAGQQEYGVIDGLPDNLFKVRRVEVNFSPSTPNSQPTRCLPVQIDAVRSNLGNTNSTVTSFHAPSYYLIGGGSTDYKLGFIPIPSESGTGAAKLWYVTEVDDLVYGTDVAKIPYPARYAKLISRYAAGVLLSKGQQEEKVSVAYMQLFERGLLKMQQQLESRVAEEAKTIVDTVGDDVDFSNYGLM